MLKRRGSRLCFGARLVACEGVALACPAWEGVPRAVWGRPGSVSFRVDEGTAFVYPVFSRSDVGWGFIGIEARRKPVTLWQVP